MVGRKSLKDELKMFERYSELTEPYFRVLKKRLESGKIDQENWAVEQLTKAYTKMIPQEITGKDGKDLIPQPILSGMPNNTISIYVPTDHGNPEYSKAPETH
jgi:hypothetical protein